MVVEWNAKKRLLVSVSTSNHLLMQRIITCGIDIGTYHVKVVASESTGDVHSSIPPKVIGTGFSESKGLRHGYIMNTEEATKSVQSAIRSAEKTAGIKISSAQLSVGGIGLAGNVFQGAISIERQENEINDEDIAAVIEAARNEMPATFSQNRRILHTIPLAYKVDGRMVLGRPHGMKGSRIETRVLFVTCLTHHLNDLILAVEDAGVTVDEVIAAPIAAASVVLSKSQKVQGCVLANIGSETVSIVVYEDGRPISLEVFPIGSSNITNDIALGLKIPLEEAELMKITGNHRGTESPKKKLDDIIRARLTDIFELIETHLEKIGRNGLLPAGIVLTGGGGGIATIEEIAKAALQLPSKKAEQKFETNTKGQIKSAEWAVAFGLCVLGVSTEEQGVAGLAKRTTGFKGVLSWFKQFLP